MDHERATGRPRKAAQPGEQPVAVGVCRQAAYGVEPRAHRDVVVENAHVARAVHQAAAQGSFGLETGDQHSAGAARQVPAQMVLDAPGIAHAAGRDDDGAGPDLVERHRFLDLVGVAQLQFGRIALHPVVELAHAGDEQFQVAARDQRGFFGHGRIDEYAQRRQLARARELGQGVEHGLGAADGECGDDDIAAGKGAGYGGDQFCLRILWRLVQPVAIGRFDQQHVGAVDAPRRRQQPVCRLAEVPRKYQAARAGGGAHARIDDGRAEDVAGIVKNAAEGGVRAKLGFVGDRVQQLEAGARLVNVVQRGRRMAAAGVAVAPAPIGFFFLQMCAVQQHDLEQLGGGRGDVDRPPVAEGGQARQQARMVDVRVGEQDEVQAVQVKIERCLVFRPGFVPSLEHAAVHQKARIPGLHQGARAGHLARAAEEAKFHAGEISTAWFASCPF